MGTLNGNLATNHSNTVIWSISTRVEFHTDRAAGNLVRGALINNLNSLAWAAINTLGVGVSAGDSFTLLS